MPSGALVDRAEEQACLMVIAHKRQTSNEFSDLLNSIKIENLSKNKLFPYLTELCNEDFLSIPTLLVLELLK